MKSPEKKQKATCSNYKAPFDPPDAGSRVGIAVQSLSLVPMHGMRIAPENGTSGWYIWAGDYSEDDDFFQPLCVDHIQEYCPLVVPFLALPPGWRFLTDGEYTDVWFDESMLTSPK